MTPERLRSIHDRTSGYCHICAKKVCFQNYGVLGARGAWEVEHSNPRANGGSDRLSNLYAACIPCNRAKGTFTTRTARTWNGNSRAPLSKEKREQAKRERAIAAGIAGGFGGGVVFGPLGAIVGAGVAAYHAYRSNPDR